jgi:hypothetical protein
VPGRRWPWQVQTWRLTSARSLFCPAYSQHSLYPVIPQHRHNSIIITWHLDSRQALFCLEPLFWCGLRKPGILFRPAPNIILRPVCNYHEEHQFLVKTWAIAIHLTLRQLVCLRFCLLDYPFDLLMDISPPKFCTHNNLVRDAFSGHRNFLDSVP